MSYAKTKLSREKQKLFDLKILSKAVKEAKTGDASKMVAKDYDYGSAATAAFQQNMKDIFGEIDDRCVKINKLAGKTLITSPGRVPPTFAFAFFVTTGQAIWTLLEENKRWTRDCEGKIKSIIETVIGGTCSNSIGTGQTFVAIADLTMSLGFDTARFGSNVLDDMATNLKLFAKEVEDQAKKSVEIAAAQSSDFLLNYIRKEKNDEKAIIKVRAGKMTNVVVTLGLIGGNIAHTVLSFGATAPLGILGIIRGCVDLAQMTATTIISMDLMADAISLEIEGVVKFYSMGKGKVKANLTEIGLGIVQGATNLNVLPSVKTCNELIEEYEHKMRTLKASYNQLQREIARLDKKIQLYQTTLASPDWDGTDKQTNAMKQVIKTATETSAALQKASDDKNDRIDVALKNILDWETSLEDVEKKTHKYTKYVSKGVSVVTSAGLGMGHIGGEAVEGAAELALRNTKLGVEAGVVVVEGLSAVLVEKLK